MATYAIGDLQGCFASLEKLLTLINFDAQCDQLWFAGDLINRGPDSLKTLRFIRNLSNVVCVLGNHDLTLLAAYYGIIKPKPYDTYQEILSADDAPELIHWLCQQPLLHHDVDKDYVLTHAGIYPLWSLAEAKDYAQEVETALKHNPLNVLRSMYGNEPTRWKPNLIKEERTRFIINAFTRMRFCDQKGNLDFTAKENLDSSPIDHVPWFLFPKRIPIKEKLIFGHWSALNGQCSIKDIFAIDTGCVWGGALTALHLESKQLYAISCVAF